MFRLISGLIKLAFLLIILGIVFNEFTAKFLLSLALHASLGTEVRIEDANIDFARARATFTNIEIDNPPNFPRDLMAYIPKIMVDLKLSSLWERRLHFDAVEVDFKELYVMRSTDGRLNLLALEPISPSDKEKSQRVPTRPGRESFFPLYIDELILSLGRATYTDLMGNIPAQKSFNLKVKDAVYYDVNGFEDLTMIIVWETMKRMGLAGMGGTVESIVDRVKGFFGKKK